MNRRVMNVALVVACTVVLIDCGAGKEVGGATVCSAGSGCAAGLFCDEERTPPACVPMRVEGEPCSASSAQRECGAGLTCNPASCPPRCAAPGEEGDHCLDDGHCANDHYCTTWWSGGTVVGTCLSKGTTGDACEFGNACLEGLYCEKREVAWECPQGWPYCVSRIEVLGGVCTPLKAEGEECFDELECLRPLICGTSEGPGICAVGIEEGGFCFGDEDCVLDLVCMFFPEEDWTCERKGLEGVRCARTEECASGLACRFTTEGGKEGICLPGGGEGDYCVADLDCVPAGMVCNYAFEPSVCRLPGKEGARCDLSDDCVDGLRCLPSGNILLCLPPSGDGGPCRMDEDCLHGLKCAGSGDGAGDDSGDEDERSCLPLGKKDDPCTEGDDCAEGLYCNLTLAGPVCKPLSAEGKKCSNAFGCMEGLFCDASKKPWVCRTKRGEGDPCAHGVDCEKGLYCNIYSVPPACASDEKCDWPACYEDVCWKEDGRCEEVGSLPAQGADVGALTTAPNYSQPLCAPTGKGEEGDQCTRTDECAPTLRCRYSEGGGAGSCRSGSGEGDYCDYESDEDSFNTLGCEFDDPIDAVCPAGMTCNCGYVPPICKPPGGKGRSCGRDRDCSEGLSCMPAPDGDVCAPPGVEGDPCLEHESCAGGFYCNLTLGSPVCTRFKAEGEACSNALDCGFQHFCDASMKPWVCRPKRGPGEQCADDVDCQDRMQCDIYGVPPACVEVEDLC